MPEPVSTEQVQILCRIADYFLSSGISSSGTRARIASYHRRGPQQLETTNGSLNTIGHRSSGNDERWQQAELLVRQHLGLETTLSESSDQPSVEQTTSSVRSGTPRAVVIGEPQTQRTSSKAKSTFKEFMKRTSSTASSSSKGRRSSRSSKRSRKAPEQTSPGITPQDQASSLYEMNVTTDSATQMSTIRWVPSRLLNTQVYAVPMYSFDDE